MEKGNSKNTSKGNSGDTKNKQDVPNKYLRVPRAKDNPSPRYEPRRKSNPQRSREFFDKRPRNRAGAVLEKYGSEVTDVALSVGHGSKRTNLNHLLNFTLVPSENWDGHRWHASDHRGNHAKKFPKYNKELFLQANCQFVARDSANYAVHQSNPDILVEWSLIEEVRLPCHERPVCPICLHDPVAAKITRCGHIYCWSCMLHYLALTDKSWQKCPICYEAVHKADLKSVFLELRKPFGVGDELTMCLMKRVRGTLLSIPVIQGENFTSAGFLPLSLCSVSNVAHVTRYQKLLLANQSEVQEIIHREQNELTNAYKLEETTPEACFIESALELLAEREKSNILLSNMQDQLRDLEGKNSNIPVRKHLTSVSSTESELELSASMSACALEVPQNFNNESQHGSTEDQNKKGNCFFYQSQDGQHIYLHNMNVRMLQMEFGCLEMAPPLLSAKIVELERVSMTEPLRKRLRYLQHLPLTCEFQVAELDFTELLSKSTMMDFDEEIKKRKMNRNRKARDERKREKMIELEENKKLGKYPHATYNINSVAQFPAYNPDDFVSLSPPKSGTFADNNYNDTTQDPAASDLLEIPSHPATSFAQMLKDNKKAFESTPRPPKPLPQHVAAGGIEDSDEDCVAAPQYSHSFSDAIQAALDAASNQDNTGKAKHSKKKGKKHQLLFTTSMCRNK